jgi:hypothetical protein
MGANRSVAAPWAASASATDSTATEAALVRLWYAFATTEVSPDVSHTVARLPGR